MGSITDVLKKHRVIAVDTCIWIYHFERHPRFAVPAERILTAIAKGRCQAIASELTLLELLTGPLKLNRQDVADEYEILLTNFPNLTLVPIDRGILLEAARIRALHGLRSPDAIIHATALAHNATLLVTNDSSWSRNSEVASLCLADFA